MNFAKVRYRSFCLNKFIIKCFLASKKVSIYPFLCSKIPFILNICTRVGLGEPITPLWFPVNFLRGEPPYLPIDTNCTRAAVRSDFPPGKRVWEKPNAAKGRRIALVRCFLILCFSFSWALFFFPVWSQPSLRV